MNEETISFADTLKNKRKQYGISQNKLAVIASLPRQYISDVETGKVNPPADRQELINTALEKLNPEAPLTMLFDYVRICFPTLDVQHIIQDVLKLNMDFMLHEDYGFYSYTEHYVMGDIFVLTSPDLEKGILLELKGQGCRQMESYLEA